MPSEPGLVLLIGLPGSGKSTLARALASQSGYMHLDRDVIRAAMFPACRFSAVEKRAANAALHAAVDAALELGDTVLVDGMTFARRAERDDFRTLAQVHGAWTQGLFLDCSVALAQARIRGDEHPAGDRNTELVAAVAARFELPEEDDVLRLDAGASSEQLLAHALAALAARP